MIIMVMMMTVILRHDIQMMVIRIRTTIIIIHVSNDST